MDTMPPQAPPAFTAHQNQAAIDTVSRLASIQAWLAVENAGMPQVGVAPTASDEAVFLDQLGLYWHAPTATPLGTQPVARGAALATQMASAMRDAGSLLEQDGSMESRASLMISELTRASGSVPLHLRASELMIGDVAYAGALVLQRIDADDIALLFLPDAGWQVFDSLAALHEATETRLRRQLVTREELPGMYAGDMERVVGDTFVASRDAGPDVFAVMVNRIATLQQQRVHEAWQEFNIGATEPSQLGDRVRDALNLHEQLDIHAVLETRDALLTELLVKERLASLPPDVRDAWRQARNAYRGALVTATRRREHADLSEPASLDQFTADALKPGLVASGVTDDPADIVVTVTQTPSEAGAWLASFFAGRPTHTISLLDLAQLNVGSVDTSNLAPARADGQPLSGALTAATLRAVVRTADVGSGYLAYLDRLLVSGTEGRASRSIALDLQQARMRFELEDSRLSIFNADEPRAFPHADRGIGYAWAKAIVNSPDAASRPRVDGHDIVAQQLVYRGITVTGVLEIATRAQESSSRVVYYTPDAPDGISFREFGSRSEAARRFLYNPIFESYLLDHLPSRVSETRADGSRHFAVSEASARAKWALSQDGGSGYTAMEERMAGRIAGGNVFDAMYDTAMVRLRLDVMSVSRSRQAADTESATSALASAMRQGNLASRASADLGMESVHGAARVLPALERMTSNIKAGDHGQAFLDLNEAYHSSLNIIGPHPVRLAPMAAAWVRTARHASTLVATRRAVTDADSLFEPAYVATGIHASDATSVKDGIYRIGGNAYVRRSDRMYGVRFDAAALTHEGEGTWRLTRPSPLDASFTGPAIERSADHVWRHSHQVGLKGGFKGANLRPGDIPMDNSWWPARRYARLTLNQRNAMASHINRSTGNIGRTRALSNWLWRRGVTQRPGRVGGTDFLPPSDRVVLINALDFAERQPAVVLIPPPPTWMTHPAPLRPATATAGSANPPAIATTPRQQPIIMRSNERIMQLEPADWPDTMWVYLGRDDIVARVGVHDTRLPQVQIASGQIQGVVGISLPPATRLADIPGIPAQAANSTASLGSTAGGWVRIDLRRVRQRVNDDVLPLFHLFAPRGPGRTGLVIVPRPTRGDPTAARDVWLQAGEFELGLPGPTH